VHHGLANLRVALADEDIGIERDLVLVGLAGATSIAVGGVMPGRVRPSLIDEERIRQLAVEKLAVEMVERRLQPAVFGRRDRPRAFSFRTIYRIARAVCASSRLPWSSWSSLFVPYQPPVLSVRSKTSSPSPVSETMKSVIFPLPSLKAFLPSLARVP